MFGSNLFFSFFISACSSIHCRKSTLCLCRYIHIRFGGRERRQRFFFSFNGISFLLVARSSVSCHYHILCIFIEMHPIFSVPLIQLQLECISFLSHFHIFICICICICICIMQFGTENVLQKFLLSANIKS